MSKVCPETPPCGTRVVRAEDLRAGDYLPQTRRTILRCSTSAPTPIGKVDVSFRRDSGAVGAARWGAATSVTVIRKEQP